jgi:hypothetical protein
MDNLAKGSPNGKHCRGAVIHRCLLLLHDVLLAEWE